MKYINVREFFEMTNLLCSEINPEKYNGVFGVPKNGSFIALIVSKSTGLELLDEPREGCLVVDDLIDSGRTRDKYKDYDFKALIEKIDNEWISWWFEKKEEDIEDSVVRILEFIGEDPNREGLKDTPKRVRKSWDKLFEGYKKEPEEVMTVFDSENYDQIVLLKDIELYSTCEHHMLPFMGKCHIAYIPNGKIVGISKLARLTEIYARRLQVQERLTNQIGEGLNKLLSPKGVGVIIEAQHFCMLCRGVEKQNSKMITSYVTGLFMDEPKAKQELMELIKS